MKANRRSGSKAETEVRSALHRSGLRFRNDYPVQTAVRSVRPDIVFTRARVAVFVDGCFWHACPEHGTKPRANREYWSAKLQRNAERDRETDVALRKAGWAVEHVWEHEDAEEAAERIGSMLHAAGRDG